MNRMTTPEHTRISRGKRLKGTVVSDALNKTAIVLVESFKKHPKYKKYMKARKRYKAHDEKNVCKKGDKVTIEETRPISKEKHFRVM